MKTVLVRVEGQVQGVFFRDFTRREAYRLEITGWVRNREDGTVEAVIQGEPDRVEKMLGWFHGGSPLSYVTQVTSSPLHHGDTFTGFSIRYS